ncbi:hypothetical protein K474DRAFT_1680049 [Panus rudis PR-1116 ss-1]|nr:hypothetical protein K474DRAFT_1680049 [Panus rudis PR-1116 ss-1]
MSSQVDAQAALLALISEKIFELRLANGFAVAATTLLYYDYIMTLPAEIRCMWRRPINAGTILFFINRYISLLYRALMLVQMSSWAALDESVADMLTASVMMALRIHALWRGSLSIFIVLFVLGLVAPAINIIVALPPPLVGCGEIVNLQTPTANFLSIFNRVFAMCFDALVLVLTWMKTWETAKLMITTRGLKDKPSMVTLILRDDIWFIACIDGRMSSLKFISDDMLGNFGGQVDHGFGPDLDEDDLFDSPADSRASQTISSLRPGSSSDSLYDDEDPKFAKGTETWIPDDDSVIDIKAEYNL